MQKEVIVKGIKRVIFTICTKKTEIEIASINEEIEYLQLRLKSLRRLTEARKVDIKLKKLKKRRLVLLSDLTEAENCLVLAKKEIVNRRQTLLAANLL